LRQARQLSVVVASVSGVDGLAQCLARLKPQCERAGAELIVARAAGDPLPALARITDGCLFRAAPARAGLPRVRGVGLSLAAGEWIALTEDTCLADEGWVEAMVRAIRPGIQVFGGGIANARRERLTDCGAFFAEYGLYGAGSNGGATSMFAAANVMYHRSVLSSVARWCEEGEWENVIHDRLRESGHLFHFAQDAWVRLNASHRIGAFCRNRFQHGRAYAEARARNLPRWQRAVLAAVTPLVPALIVGRIARSVQKETSVVPFP